MSFGINILSGLNLGSVESFDGSVAPKLFDPTEALTPSKPGPWAPLPSPPGEFVLEVPAVVVHGDRPMPLFEQYKGMDLRKEAPLPLINASFSQAIADGLTPVPTWRDVALDEAKYVAGVGAGVSGSIAKSVLGAVKLAGSLPVQIADDMVFGGLGSGKGPIQTFFPGFYRATEGVVNSAASTLMHPIDSGRAFLSHMRQQIQRAEASAGPDPFKSGVYVGRVSGDTTTLALGVGATTSLALSRLSKGPQWELLTDSDARAFGTPRIEAHPVIDVTPVSTKFPASHTELFPLQAFPYAKAVSANESKNGPGNWLSNDVLGRLADQPFTLIPQFGRNSVLVPSAGPVWGNLPSVPGLKGARTPETFVYRPDHSSEPHGPEIRMYSIHPPGTQPPLTRESNIAAHLNNFGLPSEARPTISAVHDQSYMINVFPDPNRVIDFGMDLKYHTSQVGRVATPESGPVPFSLVNPPGINVFARPAPGIDGVPRTWEDAAVYKLSPGLSEDLNFEQAALTATTQLRAGVPVKLNHVDSNWARDVFGTKFDPRSGIVANTPPRTAVMGELFTGDVPSYHALPGYPKGPLPGVTGELFGLAQELAVQKGQDWLAGTTADPQVLLRASRFDTKYPFEVIEVSVSPHAPAILRDFLPLTTEGINALEATNVGAAKALRAMSPEARGAITQALNADDPIAALNQLPLKYVEQMPPGTAAFSFRWDLRPQPALGQRITTALDSILDWIDGK